jgi:hypothetical protein
MQKIHSNFRRAHWEYYSKALVEIAKAFGPFPVMGKGDWADLHTVEKKVHDAFWNDAVSYEDFKKVVSEYRLFWFKLKQKKERT